MENKFSIIFNDKKKSILRVKEKYNSIITKFIMAQNKNNEQLNQLKRKIAEYNERIKQQKDKAKKVDNDFNNFIKAYELMKEYGVVGRVSPDLDKAEQRKEQINAETEREIKELNVLIEKANSESEELVKLNAQFDQAIEGLKTNLEKTVSELEEEIKEIDKIIGELNENFFARIESLLTSVSQLDDDFIQGKQAEDLSLDGQTEESTTKEDENLGSQLDITLVDAPQEAAEKTGDRGSQLDITLVAEAQEIAEKTGNRGSQLDESVNPAENTDDKVSELTKKTTESSIVDLGSIFSPKDIEQPSFAFKNDIPTVEEFRYGSTAIIGDGKMNIAGKSTFEEPERPIQSEFLGIDRTGFTDQEIEFIIGIMPPERYNKLTNVLNNYGIDLSNLDGIEPFVENFVTADPNVLDQNFNLLRSYGKNNDDQDFLINLNYILNANPDEIRASISELEKNEIDPKTVNIVRICFGNQFNEVMESLRQQGIDPTGVGKEHPITSVLLTKNEFSELFGAIESGAILGLGGH